MSTYEESHPVGEEWVDPVFGPVRRIPKPTSWQISRGNWFMKKEDQEAARRALGEVLRARERADKAPGADSAYSGAAEMIANDDQGNNGDHGNNSAKPVRHILLDSAIIVDGDILDPAVMKLFRELREIVNAKPKPEMNEALAEQRRCIRLFKAFGDFIKEAWRGPMPDAIGVRRYLFELASRIDLLNDGVGHPMFVPVAKRGGQLDPVEVWEGRKWACAAIECHIRSRKYKRAGAAELIAKRPILKRLMRGISAEKLREISKEQLASSLLSWHRQFQQSRANVVVQDQWRVLMRLLGAMPVPWTVKADIVLSLAIKAADKIILPKKAR